jgi:hypothetical protein
MGRRGAFVAIEINPVLSSQGEPKTVSKAGLGIERKSEKTGIVL